MYKVCYTHIFLYVLHAGALGYVLVWPKKSNNKKRPKNIFYKKKLEVSLPYESFMF